MKSGCERLRSRRDEEPRNLVDLVEQRAAEAANERAYVFLADGENESAVLTYGELAVRMRSIAMALKPLAVRRRPVLLCYPPGLEYITGFFGCLAAGAIAVPAYPPDRMRLARSLPRLQAIVADAGAAALLTDSASLPDLCEVLGGVSPSPDRWLNTEALASEALTSAPRRPAIKPGDLAFLMYTSGSTGQPKAGMVTHGNALANLRGFPGFATRPPTGFASWLPFFHDLGLFFGILHPLYRRRPSHLMPPIAFVERPLRWLEVISRYGVSATGGPNFAFDLCVSRSSPEERAALDLHHFSLALNGSEPVRGATLERFSAAFAVAGFESSAHYPSYGLSEATATVTGPWERNEPILVRLSRPALEQGEARDAEDGERSVTLVGCGRGIQEQELLIVHPETRQPLPEGRVGEIWVAGSSISAGYWRRGEISVDVHRAALADGQGAYLRSGDLGFLRQGELFLTGRLKDLIILRGVNHFPEDLEATAALAHRLLRPNCGAAFAQDDGVQGEQLVVVQEAERAPEEQLNEAIAALRQAIVAQHEIDPARVVLIAPKSLPKTSSGKIQRRATAEALVGGRLPILAEWRLAVGSEVRTPTVGKVPTAEVEAFLRSYLNQRYGLEPSRVDGDAPFDRYGLASLEAAGLASTLAEWLGRPVPITTVWEHPTVRQLAAFLAGEPSRLAAAPSLAARREPIAIVGMACRFPGAADKETLWRRLVAGEETVTEVPRERWHLERFYSPDPTVPGRLMSRKGGFLSGLEDFDAEFFGISPREAEQLDPRQRLLLELAWEALEDAAIPPSSLAGSRTGVFVATLANDFEVLLSNDVRRTTAYTGAGTADTALPNRLSYVLDLFGPSLLVNTACSGSLVAVHLACQSLEKGESTLALVGGVNLILMPRGNIFFTKAGALSAEGRCRTFDEAAAGMIRSEGAGLVVLKPLAQALADGDRIWAVIRGSAVNAGGRSNGIMAPNPHAQERLLRDAYQSSGIAPREVQYIEAHGTGTKLGDPIEVKALGAVLGTERGETETCALGSVKTNLGHMEAAAGMAGLIKVSLALTHRLLPPSLHFERPNRLIPFRELGFAVQTELGPWPRPEAPLVAGVSGFGFAGTNAHVVLAEAPANESPTPAGSTTQAATSPFLVPLSARTEAALDAVAEHLVALARDPCRPAFSSTVASLALGRDALEERLAVVASSWEEMVDQLESARSRQERQGVSRARRGAGEPARLVFVFSGQGSHWAGMGRALLATEPRFAEIIKRCDKTLAAQGVDLRLESLLAKGEARELESSAVAQSAIFAVQIALAALWSSWGLNPDAVVGQSLGEVAAAHVSGALSLEDALRVVVARGELMQRTAGRGATAVVGLPFPEAELALLGYSGRAGVAGSSSPRSSVVAGDRDAVEELVAALSQRGTFARLLKGVDIAFHSPHMDPLVDELRERLQGLAPSPSGLPLYLAALGSAACGDELDAGFWSRQLRQPFRLGEAIATLAALGPTTFLEVSPHPVAGPSLLETVTTAAKPCTVLPSLRRDEDERTTLLASLGALWCRGAGVAWQTFHQRRGQIVTLPHYPWQRERHWYEHRGLAEANLIAAFPGVAQEPLPFLGEPTALAQPAGAQLWQLSLDTAALGTLAEHRVEGAVVFPGAAFVELALSSAARRFRHRAPLELVDCHFERALILPREGELGLQLLTRPESGPGEWQLVEAWSRSEDPAPWTRHMSARVRRLAAPATAATSRPEKLAEIVGRCSERLDIEEFRASLSARAIEFPSSFLTLAKVWRSEGEALARLELPAEVEDPEGRLGLHPVLLDALLQLVAAALPRDYAPGKLFLPAKIARLLLHQAPARAAYGHVRLPPAALREPGRYLVDMALLDESGRSVVEIEALEYLALAGKTSGSDKNEVATLSLAWRALENAPRGRRGLAGPCLVWGDDTALARSLAGQLRQAGVVVEREREVVASLEPYELVIALPSGEERLAGVVALARNLLTGKRIPHLTLVTRGAHRPWGEGVLDPRERQLWGFAAALASEHPELGLEVFDIDGQSDEADAVALAEEVLAEPSEENRQLLRAEGRWAPRLVPASLPLAGSPRLVANATYLVTGGLSGLGLATARWLVGQGARRLLLIQRTPLPPRTSWAALGPHQAATPRVEAVRELESLGASVHVAAVDVGDHAALAAALAAFRAEGWPPIRGVIHAAGVLADRLLSALKPEDLRDVLGPKLEAALTLDQLTRDEPLDFFVLAGSLASHLPPPGQIAYAAANAGLDGLAEARQLAGRPGLSIAWGPWAETGMTAGSGLEELHAAAGVRWLARDRALETLGRAFSAGLPSLAIAALDLERLCRQSRSGRLLAELAPRAAETQVEAPEGSRDLLFELLLEPDQQARRELVTARFVHLLAAVMRFDVTRLDRDKPLTAMGLDSIMAVDLNRRLEQSLGLSLSLMDLLMGTSVEQLVDRLMAQLEARNEELGAIEQLLAELEPKPASASPSRLTPTSVQ